MPNLPPNLPQDPRQLAQEILAGRISIQDLAREQARRRAVQAGNAPAAAQNRPPLAQTQPQPQPIPRQVAPVRPPSPRQSAPPPVSGVVRTSKTATSLGRQTSRQNKPLANSQQKSPQKNASLAQPPTATSPKAISDAYGQMGSPRMGREKDMRSVIRRVLASPQNVRTVFAISELLAPPVALRTTPPWPEFSKARRAGPA